MREYNVVNGRKITSNGFCQALDFSKKPVVFRTQQGKLEPVMLGVTEFGLKDCEELFKGENHVQTHKVGARPIIWLPNAKKHGKGLTIYMDYYVKMQQNPELYPEQVKQLAEAGIGMDIDCR